MNKTSNADKVSEPVPCTAQIIRFPIEQIAGEFDLSFDDWCRAHTTLGIAAEFTGMDDDEIETTLQAMLQKSRIEAVSAIHHMVRRNGEVLETLRKALGFLSVMDRRLMAATNRMLDQTTPV